MHGFLAPANSSRASSLCAPGRQGVHILACNVPCGALPFTHAQTVTPVALGLYDHLVADWPAHADQRHALQVAIQPLQFVSVEIA